jgi:hypothetical protein
VLSLFDPLVSDWFSARFDKATEPQVLGWPAIREGHDVLISAPTGSGKTLAAFLLCIDDLVRRQGHFPAPGINIASLERSAISSQFRRSPDPQAFIIPNASRPSELSAHRCPGRFPAADVIRTYQDLSTK